MGAFDDRLVAVDEFHHASANPDNRLGVHVGQLMARDKAHIVAMTGSYFRGDAEPVLMPEDEERFQTVHLHVLRATERLRASDAPRHRLLLLHGELRGRHPEGPRPGREDDRPHPERELVGEHEGQDKIRDVDHLRKQGLARGRYNQIAIFVLAQSEINIAIGDRAPEVYFKELAEQCAGGKKKYGGITDVAEMRVNLRMSCLPESLLDGPGLRRFSGGAPQTHGAEDQVLV